MKNMNLLLFSLLLLNVFAEKINLDTLKNYSGFLNFGEKKVNKLQKDNLENSIFKSKVDILGELFKVNVDMLKKHSDLDLVFLVDASSSVGAQNFRSELKFVKKLLSDITVDYNHTRISVITFSSSSEININIDEISQPSQEHNKCLLLNKQLGKIEYKGGGTYTLGAFQAAKEIFANSHRNNTQKALFLITDGYSNGGDPVPLSNDLKDQQILIFTIGIRNGNYKELYEISSSPGEFHSYLLDSFEEFEGLARRALHVDLKNGEYVPLGVSNPCDGLCKEGNCCDDNAVCSCGTTTGHYSCVCKLGYYGNGLRGSCTECFNGSYSNGPNTCFPCPDINHYTVTPAIGVESCKCKIGFQPTNDNKCKIMKCPKIEVPEHGYVVKKRECGNVLNSACGIRCEVGYTLVGKSIRLCQANATWTGTTPSCEVKVCKSLPVPKFGTMNCSHSDIDIEPDALNLPVDTTCVFECDHGNNRIGSYQRTCLPLAQWDGLRTLCKPIKCPKLPQVKFGKWEPKSCNIGKQEFKKNCTIICDEGFEVKGPKEKICGGKHNSWSNKLEDTLCVDVTPPVMNCPSNITITTEPGKKYGVTSWKTPEVTDNSNLDVSLWMKPAIKNITGFKFPIGRTKIEYHAQDGFQNAINCSFYITVIDEEIPTIEGCVDPESFLTINKGGANVTWDEPNIIDNSQNVTITKSHNFGFFPIGTTTVIYTARDSSNNTNICKINITVEEDRCEALPDPIFGHSNCSSDPQGIQCVITCEEGYAIPINQNIENVDNGTNFYCNHASPQWITQNGENFPECSVTQIPDVTTKSGELSLRTDYSCDNTSSLQTELKNDIQSILCEKDCDINMDYKCDEDLQKIEEETNRIQRDLSGFEEMPHRNKTKRYKSKINVKFQVKGKYLRQENDTLMEVNRSRHYFIKINKTKFVCPSGFVPRKNRCVQCPRGMFHNVTINKCEVCPLGYYNDQVSQTTCISCPRNYSTRKIRSKNAKECRAQCPPGTYARRRWIKYTQNGQKLSLERASLSPHCRSCDIGYFQPDYGKVSCLKCSAGYITTGYRSLHQNQCVPTAMELCNSIKNICNNGTCSVINEFQYNCNCFEGYYGTFCERKHSPCDSQPCLNRGLCEPSHDGINFFCNCPPDYTGRYCQESRISCPMNCMNGGTCMESEENDFSCLCPDNFGGELCEVPLKYCTNQLCENNGTCVEEKHNYRCICPRGYLGRRCTILPCDYQPCDEKYVCVNIMEPNATRNSYRCLCPDGFTGPTCSDRIDFCGGNPCLNNGSCISETYGYVCKCSKLYYGVNCEIKKRTNYLLEFPQYDTNNYIKLKGFSQNITEISACLWMETTDSFNYGTLISYATRKLDNSFTLTDYTGLILYINGQYVVTDILLNDGFWHHVCASWTNTNGFYKVYVDGKLVKSGSGLSPGSHIQGEGSLVIGQDQDTLGGMFSQSESFLGKMSYIDIWSRVLTLEEILRHMNECNNTEMGDLYAWPDIQYHVMGDIKILNSTFCQGCKSPLPLYNGLINVVDNVAFYSCYVGYRLVNNVYKNGRKCTKMANWEGVYEPHCKKVYCGYPGYVRNSFPIERNYYFKDTITYRCYSGFTLIGNSSITCQADGTWYPNKPKCIGQLCPILNAPENGKLSIISESGIDDKNQLMESGTQLEIICDENATLTGESVLTCLDNGEWDFPLPNCTNNELVAKKLMCPMNLLPQPPANGYVDEDSLKLAKNASTKVVFYKCRNGFNLKGDNFTTCIIDGYWTEINVTCEAVVCPKPKKPPYMQLKHKEENLGVYVYGNKITYECRKKYKLIGNDTIRCQESGQWSNTLGKCVKVCDKPIIKSTTKIIGNSFDVGSSITLVCSSGSKYTLLCNKLGAWQGRGDSSC